MSKTIIKAPIIGFIRYSQKVKFREQVRDAFEPEYFEYRFDIFKNITLRSFQQQTNQNFVLLLLHSENMPSHYKERFIELEQSNFFLFNIFVKDTQKSFDEGLAKSVDFVEYKNDVAITFRIDNDDAVPNDFIHKLSNFTYENFNRCVINIPSVSIIQRIADQSYMKEERYYPSHTIGLAYVSKKNEFKTVLELGEHTLVNKDNSMLLLAAYESGGLMTINGENAANSIDRSNSVILNEIDLKRYLIEKKMDNLDLTQLRVIPKPKYSVKRLIELMTPPVFKLLKSKLNFL